MADAQKNLTLYYEGVNITEYADILECVVRDVSGRESDCLNLLADHAEKWLQWGVEKNDRIRVTRSGYDTKTMYVKSVAPEGGAYRIYATGMKCAPFEEKWASYENMTLAAIMGNCAGEGGMGCALHGVNGNILYPYLMRRGKRAPEFVEGLLRKEGAVLKCLNGQFTAIGIGYAQGLPCAQVMEISRGMKEAEYIFRPDRMWSSVTIDTPFGKGVAIDSRGKGKARVFTEIPAEDDAQAARWARGMLMSHNRECEELNIRMDFNPGLTAMVRVDVDSQTAASGHWIVDWTEQDLKLGRTKARLLRCVTGIS